MPRTVTSTTSRTTGSLRCATETKELIIETRHVTEGTLDNGERSFENRNYVWFDVPANLRGWRFTRTFGGETAFVSVIAKQDTTIYMAIAQAREGVDLSGWTKVEGSEFGYTDRGRSTDGCLQPRRWKPIIASRFPKETGRAACCCCHPLPSSQQVPHANTFIKVPPIIFTTTLPCSLFCSRHPVRGTRLSPLSPRRMSSVNSLVGRFASRSRLLSPPHEPLGARAVEMLEARLADIASVLAPEPLAKLRKYTIVLDLTHGDLRGMPVSSVSRVARRPRLRA